VKIFGVKIKGDLELTEKEIAGIIDKAQTEIYNIVESAIESLTEHGLTVKKIKTDGTVKDQYTRNIWASFSADFRYYLPQMTYEIAEVLM